MVETESTPELKCRKCDDWMLLAFEDYTLRRDGISVLIRECPILKCPSCQFFRSLANDFDKEFDDSGIESSISQNGVAVIKIPYTADPSNRFQFLNPAIFDKLSKDNKKYEEITPEIPKQKFNYCKVEFLHDPRDYYYVPGLYRSSGDGFLTPLFLNKKVLLKYTRDPRYAIDFVSDTYGVIYADDWGSISFGVNRVGRVVMWLGDIDKLPQSEQHYLRSENVDSDHDVASEFYQGQIEIRHTKPSKEKLTLRARHEMVTKTFETLKVKIAHLDLEIVPILKTIVRPITWDRREIDPVIDAMNKIMIESISNIDLKADILRLDPKIDLKDLKGIQLFEMWLENRGFPEAEKTISPLRALNRLRNVFAHLLPTRDEEKFLTSACEYLGLPADCRDWGKIYDVLIDALQTMYKKIAAEIASLPNGK